MAEGAWKVIAFLVVLAGGTTTALVAKSTELFGSMGLLAWIGIGAVAALISAIIIHIVATASLKTAEAEYTRAMARERVAINPLSDSFSNQIIRIEEMRLPTKQLHRHKQFKNCHFVGPGAIAILGGTFSHCTFTNCGDFIPLPDAISLTGIVALDSCIVEKCEFHRITILTPQQVIDRFRQVSNFS